MKVLKSKLSLKVKIPPKVLTSPIPPLSDCTHITENIYLSSYKTSTDYHYLKENNFTHIINCAGGSSTFSPVYFKDFSYLTLQMRDDCACSIEEGVEQFATFMRENCNDRNKILIHCWEGISRAPAILCAYLMWKNKIGFREALGMIKEKRSCVDLNLGFMFQLENMSRKLIKV